MLGHGYRPAPTPDAVLFRPSAWRVLPVVPLIVAFAALANRIALLVASNGTDLAWDDTGSVLAIAAAGATIGAAINIWRMRRNPIWIRVSAAGIELAPRGRPVLLPFDNIDVARVRRRGLLARLEVTPKDLYAIRTELPSRDLPLIRYKRDRAILTMEIGLLRPGPRRLQAELDRFTTPG